MSNHNELRGLAKTCSFVRDNLCMIYGGPITRVGGRMRRYAQNTTVGVAKSRSEIDRLLRDWKCEGVQWTDEFAAGRVTLRFMWSHSDRKYMGRVSVRLPSDKELEDQAVDGRSSGRVVSSKKLEVLRAARGRQEHRLLLLWLKATFNAVEAGLVTAEEVLLPFLEGQDGRTVAEVAIPRLADLSSGPADKLMLAVSDHHLTSGVRR